MKRRKKTWISDFFCIYFPKNMYNIWMVKKRNWNNLFHSDRNCSWCFFLFMYLIPKKTWKFTINLFNLKLYIMLITMLCENESRWWKIRENKLKRAEQKCHFFVHEICRSFYRWSKFDWQCCHFLRLGKCWVVIVRKVSNRPVHKLWITMFPSRWEFCLHVLFFSQKKTPFSNN